jgi:hypothetical protein
MPLSKLARELLLNPIAGALLVAIVAVYAIEWLDRGGRRAELIRFMDLASAARTPEQAEQQFARVEARSLTLKKLNPELWLVSTPFEYTANNWLLYLEFRRGQLVALRIRTSDGPHDHPRGAPADVTMAALPSLAPGSADGGHEAIMMAR